MNDDKTKQQVTIKLGRLALAAVTCGGRAMRPAEAFPVKK